MTTANTKSIHPFDQNNPFREIDSIGQAYLEQVKKSMIDPDLEKVVGGPSKPINEDEVKMTKPHDHADDSDASKDKIAAYKKERDEAIKKYDDPQRRYEALSAVWTKYKKDIGPFHHNANEEKVEEAEKILRTKFGYNDKQISKLKESIELAEFDVSPVMDLLTQLGGDVSHHLPTLIASHVAIGAAHKNKKHIADLVKKIYHKAKKAKNIVDAGHNNLPDGELAVEGTVIEAAKDRFFTNFAVKVALGQKGVDSLHAGKCPMCHGDATEFKDEVSKREHEITGLCQKCQDEMFKEETISESSYDDLKKQVDFTKAAGKDITPKQSAWLKQAEKRLASGKGEPTVGGPNSKKGAKMGSKASDYWSSKSLSNEETITENAMDIQPQKVWWKNAPDNLMGHIYWMKNQLPPSDPVKKHKNYQNIVSQLQKKYPAPEVEYQKHLNHYSPKEEIVNEKKHSIKKNDSVAHKKKVIKREKLWADTDKDGKVTFKPKTSEAMDSILNKSIDYGISPLVLLEVYSRGYQQPEKEHLTQDQQAFNAVNSFIAKGKAWNDYEDLREMTLDSHSREQGTDSLRNTYANDTPGQKVIQTIRKAIKKNDKQ